MEIRLIIILMFCSLASFGQDFKKNGLLKATATIAPGISNNDERFYLHGHLEYFPEEKVSLRGDDYLNMNSSSQFMYTHSVFFGALYHFKENSNFDPYFGFQPGIALSKCYIGINPELPQLAISPLMSASVGANYYVGNYFNFFASGQYVIGKYMSDDYFNSKSLNELRISAGLGFNIGLKKE